MLIVAPNTASTRRRPVASVRLPWAWVLVAVSFGLTALLGLLGDSPAAGARAFRFVAPLLVLLVFLTSRMFTGRVTAPAGYMVAAVVFLVEAPVIYLHLHDLTRAHGGAEYTAVFFPVLLLSAMAVSMTMVAILDRLNRLMIELK